MAEKVEKIIKRKSKIVPVETVKAAMMAIKDDLMSQRAACRFYQISPILLCKSLSGKRNVEATHYGPAPTLGRDNENSIIELFTKKIDEGTIVTRADIKKEALKIKQQQSDHKNTFK